jgi:hypothetical protein
MIIVLALAVVILVVALAGVLVLMRAGMNREGERYLTNEPPTRIAAATRAITGLHVRMPDRDTQADEGTARLSVPASRGKSIVL